MPPCMTFFAAEHNDFFYKKDILAKDGAKKANKW